MDKLTFDKSVQACKDDTGEALQIVYDALNPGQKKKILKNEKVKALFDLYGVEIQE